MLTCWCSFDCILFVLQLPGLTKETLLVLTEISAAITGRAKYLINFCAFKHALLGKIQSDMIKGRIGRIPQLGGANYFISTCQLLESDQKLKTLSLVKCSHISVSDIEKAVKENCSEFRTLYLKRSCSSVMQCSTTRQMRTRLA